MMRKKTVVIFFDGNAMHSINGRGLSVEQKDNARGAGTKTVSNITKYARRVK